MTTATTKSPAYKGVLFKRMPRAMRGRTWANEKDHTKLHLLHNTDHAVLQAMTAVDQLNGRDLLWWVTSRIRNHYEQSAPGVFGWGEHSTGGNTAYLTKVETSHEAGRSASGREVNHMMEVYLAVLLTFGRMVPEDSPCRRLLHVYTLAIARCWVKLAVQGKTRGSACLIVASTVLSGAAGFHRDQNYTYGDHIAEHKYIYQDLEAFVSTPKEYAAITLFGLVQSCWWNDTFIDYIACRSLPSWNTCAYRVAQARLFSEAYYTLTGVYPSQTVQLDAAGIEHIIRDNTQLDDIRRNAAYVNRSRILDYLINPEYIHSHVT